MTVYQTRRAIKTLRLAARSGPLPMALHDLITKSLIDLIRHRDLLLAPRERPNDPIASRVI